MNLSIYSSSRKYNLLILLPVNLVVQFLFCSGITKMIPLPLCEATYTQPFISSWSIFSSAHSVMADSATPRTAALQASLSITNSQSFLKLTSIELVMPSNHLILCCPLFLPPSIFPNHIYFQMSQFFASGGQSIGVSASIFPMNIQD